MGEASDHTRSVWIVDAAQAALQALPDPNARIVCQVSVGESFVTAGEAVFRSGRLWRLVQASSGAVGYIRDVYLVPAGGDPPVTE
jgi:hypothetical protein